MKRRPGRSAYSKFWTTNREIRSPANAITLPTLSGRVEFRAVSFSYQDEKSSALTGVDLAVEPNQIVALIGETGSGKTSLVNLIPRFYDVTEGAVLVDGVDVRSVDLESLRRRIGIVLQTRRSSSPTQSGPTSSMAGRRPATTRSSPRRRLRRRTSSSSTSPTGTRPSSASAA